MSDLSSTRALNLRSEQHAWQSPPQPAGVWQSLHTAVGGSWTRLPRPARCRAQEPPAVTGPLSRPAAVGNT